MSQQGRRGCETEHSSQAADPFLISTGKNFLLAHSFSSRISPARCCCSPACTRCFPGAHKHQIHAGSMNPVLCKTAVTLTNLPLLRGWPLLNVHADGM